MSLQVTGTNNDAAIQKQLNHTEKRMLTGKPQKQSRYYSLLPEQMDLACPSPIAPLPSSHIHFKCKQNQEVNL